MSISSDADPERRHLAEAKGGTERWSRWGPYLADRQWGTVREDYSEGGDAWNAFPHDRARSRADRWGEDGLLGIADDQARLCFGLALWNGQDSILKERLFGLTGSEGNHGEDVKEQYVFLDAIPSHAYLKALYKYPQRAFPYAALLSENRRRSRSDPEFELRDTGASATSRPTCRARLESIFLRDAAGRRPVFGADEGIQPDPNWRDHVLFYESFNGDTGAGLGASHQTGWTGLVAKLLERDGRRRVAIEPDPTT